LIDPPHHSELLDLTVERVPRAAGAIVVTFLPEFQPPGPGRRKVTILALNRLDAARPDRVSSAGRPAQGIAQLGSSPRS